MELNKVMIVGNLCRDPETRSTSGGKHVANLRLGVNRKRPGGEDETLFIDVTLWEKQAEFCEKWLGKGVRVFVEGRLMEETWEDRETKKQRSKIVIVGERVQFAESKKDGDQERREAPAAAPAGQYPHGKPQSPADDDESSLPF